MYAGVFTVPPDLIHQIVGGETALLSLRSEGMPADRRRDPDAARLRAWADGDAEAGNVLVRRHFSSVFRFFRSKVDRDLDDLVQEVFRELFTHADRFDPAQGSFRAFIFSIARHVLLRHARKTARQQRRETPEGDPASSLWPSPSGTVAAAQEVQLLAAALRSLPLSLQSLLELYYWEGLRTEELAEVFSIPKGTVLSRLHRARTLVREFLESSKWQEQIRLSAIRDMDRWARQVAEALAAADSASER